MLQPKNQKKTLTLPLIFYFMKAYTYYILSLFLLIPAIQIAGHEPANNKRFTVVIDAGHGGHDPGAIGHRGKEKNINLSVALKLGRLIERNCSDTRVVYTRSTDKFVALHERAEIANNAKANLFISIHTNSLASRTTKVSGTETYTLGLHKTEENLEVAKKENSVILIESDYKKQYAGFNPNSAESYIIFEFLQDKYMSQSVSFAKSIQQQFKQTARRPDKGVHQAGFLVLRETSMPSVLIELGYINNPTEEAYLLSDNGSSALAQSIYKAFAKYRNLRNEEHAENSVPAQQSVESQPQIPEGKEIQESNVIIDQPAAEEAKPDNATKREAVKAEANQEPQSKPIRQQEAQSQDKPVFKIQILTAGRVLQKGSPKFKGLSPVSYYKENGIYKYTYCESTNYNHVLREKRSKVDSKFKDAFIIAFKNGEKMNVSQAIKEFKNNRK